MAAGRTDPQHQGAGREQGIVHNQRGIGFFLADGAYETTRELKKRIFVSRDLPQVFKTMDLLRMGFDDLKELYEAHRGKEKEEKTV
ncbi:MAG: hypothetical protein NT005_17410 [Spirochaetes bacterium]|nr:hypothetical protein [Spirochaetota bacterium]